ncbi:MAG: glycoside hydrolase family 3 C-terminal domain-containing protein [Bacteroidota bacterium]
MKNLLLLSLVYLLLCFSALGQEASYPFQNPNLSLEERVEDLIDRMTIEEKVGQLRYDAPAIDRLDIPSYNWWNECLHGVARNGRATIFPQAIGMAATFDNDLIFRVGEAVSTEARAKYNVSVEKGFRRRYQGLTFWTPNVNLFRDPRWGRGQETYGEDPFLTSQMGIAYVKGLQGDHPTLLKSAAMAKHYAVHSGPEALRHEFDAKVSMKDLWETYLPAFEALVTEADVEGIMGAYNRTNGEPCNAHPYLMEEVLRKQWGFDGYFVSDCWAIVDFFQGHKISKDAPSAAAFALNNGCNLNCGSSYQSLMESLEKGYTTEDMVDENLRELLPTRFKLGLFDPMGSGPWDKLGPEVIACDDHIKLSKEAATKSIVMLKNEGLLPLDKGLESIFVTGPMATHAQALLGNYYGLSPDMKTILEGVVGKVEPHTSVHYSQGALLDEKNRNPVDWFSGEAGDAEVTIACLGNSQLWEGEEGEAIASRHLGDRADIQLPQNQVEFLKTIRSKAKKLVVVVTGGSAIAFEEVYELADAVIFVWYPGEQGGSAVGDILFGDANPSGRLPVSFPKSIKDLPPYEDYNMTNRTYRYMEVDPLFPFGFGLSYTKFAYSDMKLSAEKIKSGESMTVSVRVSNTGTVKGEEVIQLYLKDKKGSVVLPKMALKGFKRVNLWPGASEVVKFVITPDMMRMVNEDGERMIEKGEFEVFVGGSLPDKRSYELGASKCLSGTYSVR